MIWFLVVISVTNIALGYGLAVYLGHGQVPWSAAYPLPATDSVPPSTSDDDVADFSNKHEDATEEHEAAETLASEAVDNESAIPESGETPRLSPAETTDNTSEQEPLTEVAAEQTEEPSAAAEDEILNGLENVRTQLADMHQQFPASDESTANEAAAAATS